MEGEEELEFLGADKKGENSYSAAFGLKPSVLLSDVSSLTMIIGDKMYKTDLFGENSIIDWNNSEIYTEGGKLMLAILIDGVDAQYVKTDESGNIAPDFMLYVE